MNNILTLIKINLIEQYRINKLFKKDKIIAKIGFVLLYLVIFATLTFSIGSIFYLTAITVENPNDALSEVLKSSCAIVAILSIISVLVQANGFLFKSKDFDLLVSLPIKKRDIIISKIFALLISSYLGMLVTYIPAIVVIGILGIQTQFIFYFNSLIIFILFPLGLVSISSFISLIIGKIFSNFKYKNLLIVSLAVVGVVLYLIYSFNIDPTTNPYADLSKFLNYIYYPANFAINTLLGSFNFLLIFILFNIGLFLVFINILGKYYLKLNTSQKRKRKKNNKALLVVKKSSQNKTLIKSEFKKYFSIPQYVINTIIGKVLLPVGMIYFSFQMANIELDPSQPLPVNEIVYILLAGLAVFTITLTSTTSVTISLEGESIWVLKTMPVSTNQIFLSKIVIDLTTTIIGGLIGLIGVLIFLPFNLIGFITLTILIIALGLHNAILGLIINLRFPKLKWDLPVRVIKQSLSVVIHMLISFLLVIILVVGAILLSNVVRDANLILIIFTLFIILIVVIEGIVLNKFGNKWFNKL